MAVVLGCSSTKILEYSVEKFSSYLSNYIPEGIPLKQGTSRRTNPVIRHLGGLLTLTILHKLFKFLPDKYAFLLLKLQQCAITDSITFGKYEKTHVCNLKKFKVFGGLQESNMVELLEGGLKNDSTPETFNLKHEVEGYRLPCRYIKIVPLQSWGPSFNFSVWFVELRGRDDPAVVQPSVRFFYEYREREAIRLCLKHFRQRGSSLLPVFEVLQSCTGVILEDPRLSALHNTLVVQADYSGAEAFMEKALQDGLLDQYLRGQDYSPMWSRILSIPTSEDEDLSLRHPGMRGGHQMCMDPHTDTIFLFGGWDGTQDLSDFWQYHVPTSQWTKLSNKTEAQGGPSARSCHKMCLDPDRRQIFTLGRYLDTQYRSPEKVKSDFYVYDIERRKWTVITEDTAAVGGPQLIFDHQMCMDHEHSTIYVFGGRVLTPTPGDTVFSGLYAFHVATSTWSKLCEDSEVPVSLAATGVGSPVIRSRVGHSMLFHPGLRELFIFAGQRNREYLNDFFSFNVDTHQVRIIWDGGNGCISAKSKDSSPNVPATGYTQRATIDPELNEIYVLSGLSKDKEKRDDNVQNSFWVYYINQNYWYVKYCKNILEFVLNPYCSYEL
ncbi:hypothetical protein B566_EDAN001671 [Ephemera danica]|nr:hypothetical protein B566_EDAN001671 [Ephemera danica]